MKWMSWFTDAERVEKYNMLNFSVENIDIRSKWYWEIHERRHFDFYFPHLFIFCCKTDMITIKIRKKVHKQKFSFLKLFYQRIKICQGIKSGKNWC